jgi:integrase
MAKKVRQRLRSIMDFAVEEGLIAANPIPAPRRHKRTSDRKHLAAVTTRDGVGEILRAAAKADVGRGVRRAHLLLVFTAQRISEVVGARWDEFDLDGGQWSIPRDRMKRKDRERGPHVVPLPPRLRESLRQWKEEDGSDGEYVCPSRTGEPITREAVEKFYRRGLGLSGRHSPHSWRTVLSTWANDAGKEWDVVEAQLDHEVGSKVKVAYDRGKRLERRADLMAWYEGVIYLARDGGEVVPLSARLPAR